MKQVLMAMLAFALVATGAHAEEEVDSSAFGERVQEYLELGGVMTSVGVDTHQLGVHIDERDVDAANATAAELKPKVKDFSARMIQLVDTEHHSTISKTTKHVLKNLTEIQRAMTDEDFQTARAKYQEMMEQWKGLGRYATGDAPPLPSKEEFKGWVDQFYEFFYDWWYGEDTPESE